MKAEAEKAEKTDKSENAGKAQERQQFTLSMTEKLSLTTKCYDLTQRNAVLERLLESKKNEVSVMLFIIR